MEFEYFFAIFFYKWKVDFYQCVKGPTFLKINIEVPIQKKGLSHKEL